jgi:hypothetical protein
MPYATRLDRLKDDRHALDEIGLPHIQLRSVAVESALGVS